MNDGPIENVDLTMLRLDLDAIPDAGVPPPYRLRWYQPGDEAAWTAIHLKAERFNAITPGLFRRQFGKDNRILAERQAYMCDKSGAAVATATAWFDKERGADPPWGRVHWVAVDPDHQGKGLSKVLMTAILRRMRGHGHKQVCLTTSTGRLAAIHLYLQYGFVPEIDNEFDRDAWRTVRTHLAHPALDAI